MKYQGITIQKNKNCKTWYARYRKNGKQFYISAKTQQACYDKLKLSLKQKVQPKPEHTNLKLTQWYQEWLNTFKNDVSESTKKNYKSTFNNLYDLQSLNLTQITNIDIQKALNKITMPRTKQKAYELLDMLFKKALISEKINKDPMLYIEKPKYTRTNGKPFSAEDERIFIKNCKEQKLDLFLVGLYQGLRHGEILAITDKDINFENKTLTINKSLNQNGKFGKTKNNSDRVQPIFNKTLEILEKYKNTQGRIFTQSYKLAEKQFKQAITGLSQAEYTIKTLRFTFITKCQENNIPEHIIQKWVGHKIGSTVTKQVYTKIRTQAENENITIYNKILD